MEQPNILTIKEIADGDIDFQNSILEILKKEFKEEVTIYKRSFSSKNLKEASKNVHKIKHKISLLGLNDDLDLATNHEYQLNSGTTELHNNFLEILNKIHVYLYD